MHRRIRIAIEDRNGWGLVWLGTEIIGRVHADGAGYTFYRGTYNVSTPEMSRASRDELRDDLEAIERSR